MEERLTLRRLAAYTSSASELHPTSDGILLDIVQGDGILHDVWS